MSDVVGNPEDVAALILLVLSSLITLNWSFSVCFGWSCLVRPDKVRSGCVVAGLACFDRLYILKINLQCILY